MHQELRGRACNKDPDSAVNDDRVGAILLALDVLLQNPWIRFGDGESRNVVVRLAKRSFRKNSGGNCSRGIIDPYRLHDIFLLAVGGCVQHMMNRGSRNDLVGFRHRLYHFRQYISLKISGRSSYQSKRLCVFDEAILLMQSSRHFDVKLDALAVGPSRKQFHCLSILHSRSDA